jgi:hypothetical protein
MLLFIYLLDISFPLLTYTSTHGSSIDVRCPMPMRCTPNTDAYEVKRHEFERATVDKDGTDACLVSFSLHRQCVFVSMALVSEERSTVLVRGSTFSEGTQRESAVI